MELKKQREADLRKQIKTFEFESKFQLGLDIEIVYFSNDTLTYMHPECQEMILEIRTNFNNN